MTPADHYTEAERLLKLAIGDFPATTVLTEVLAAAQVHATLATVDTSEWPLSRHREVWPERHGGT